MFIRRAKIRTTERGDVYYSYRLVRNERSGDRVRQHTLLNLGSDFPLERGHWAMLCARIQQLLDRQGELVPLSCPEEVERHAQRIAAQLLNRAPPAAVERPDLQTVDVSSLELIRPRSVGVENAGLWAMEQLGLEALLERLGFNGTQRALALATIIARMAAPGSERASWRWLCERSALGELLGVDFERMSMMRLYRASDALLAQRAAIEGHLFEQVADLFGLPQTVTLYDLTNTFFEGEAAAQPKAQRGHSKEKRSDCPLLTLGLVIDGSGFVRRSEVFAGAVNEDTTLAPMLEALHAPADALVVMDAGVATEANVVWLRENGYRYLVVSRERARRFDPDLAIALETRSRQTVHVHKVVEADGGEVRLYCYSEARAKTEQGIAALFAARFEGELRKLHDGLKRPRTRKRLDHVWQRIGRIKEKSRGVGAHYVIAVIADDSGKKARAVTWERRPLAGTMITHPGVYCLRTNVEDWDEETLWRTYTALTDVEAVFRSLKSELGLRPIFHQTQKRSDGHLFITVIAYQLVQTIRRRLGEQGEHASWACGATIKVRLGVNQGETGGGGLERREGVARLEFQATALRRFRPVPPGDRGRSGITLATFLTKGARGAWPPHQRSPNEAFHDPEEDPHDRDRGGKGGLQPRHGLPARRGSVPAFPEGGAAGPASAGPSGRHLRDRGGADPGGQSGDPPRGRVPGADAATSGSGPWRPAHPGTADPRLARRARSRAGRDLPPEA